MPRIDLMSGGDQIQDQIHGPEIDIKGQGAVGNAIAQVGEDAQKIGLNIMQKRKQAQDTDFAFTKTLEDAKEISRYEQQLKQDPNGLDGYAKKMQDFMQSRIDKNYEDSPSDEARIMYDHSARHMFTENLISSEKFENTEKVKKYGQNLVDGNTQVASRYMYSPVSSDQFKAENDFMVDGIKGQIGTTLNPEQAADFIRKSKEQRAVGQMVGYEAQGASGYDSALDALKPGNPIGDSLEESTKAKYLVHFSNLKEQDQVTSASEIRNQVKDIKTDSFNMVNIKPSYANGIINGIKTNPKIKKDEKARLIEDVQFSVHAGEDLSKLGTTPRSQWASEPSIVAGSGFNSSGRQSLVDRFNQLKNQFEKKQELDPVDTTLKSFAPLQALEKQSRDKDPGATKIYLDKLMATQNTLEIRNPKVVSNAQVHVLGDLINKAPTDASKVKTIDDLKTKYGSYFPKVFNQLADKNKETGGGVDPKLALVAFASDAQSKENIVANVTRGDRIQEDFGAGKTFDETTTSRLKEEVNKRVIGAVDAINAGVSDGSNAALASSVRHQVLIEAMKQKQNDRNLEPAEAATRAYNTIIKSNFTPIATANSNVLMPRVDGKNNPYNEDLARSFIKTYSTKEGLRDLDIGIPGGVNKEQVYETLPSQVRWVNNGDHSGIKLTVMRPGGLKPVFDSKGKQIERSFQDITDHPDQRTLDGAKTKLFGMIPL